MNEAIEVIIRVAKEEDAKAMIGFTKQVGTETDFLSFGQEGIDIDVEAEKSYIRSYENSENSIMIVAEVDDQIVAIASLAGRNGDRSKHIAELGISLIREYWGYGIATQMMEMMIEFAENSPLEVLILEVISENDRAIALYEKFGFESVGKFAKRSKVGHKYYDTIFMQKLL